MPDAAALLTDLQRRLLADTDLTIPFYDYDRLLFLQAGDLLHVEYYGLYCDDPFRQVLETLARPEVAARLAVLRFDGPDDGANGTREWDFSPLLDSEALFPRLTSVRVALHQSGDHNRPLIGSGYEEGGMIARLLDRMPNLRDLMVPSAPDAAFFDRPPHPLATLCVDAGYDHQDFILHLSRSSCFPDLLQLDFGDVDEEDADDYPAACVPFEHYVALFQAPAFASAHLRLRNAPLTAEQIQQLTNLRPTLAFEYRPRATRGKADKII